MCHGLAPGTIQEQFPASAQFELDPDAATAGAVAPAVLANGYSNQPLASMNASEYLISKSPVSSMNSSLLKSVG